MKTRAFIFLAILALGFVSCSNDDPSFDDEIKDTWKLLRITGGLAGIDCDYSEGEVLWVFDGSQLMYEVKNDSTTNSESCEGFVTTQEVKAYTIEEKDGLYNLFLNDSDRGEVTIENDTLTLDSNKLQDGTGTDGFFYRLLRQ